MSVEQALAQFKETEGGESFRLQNSKLLKVELANVTIQKAMTSAARGGWPWSPTGPRC
jgi:hypothetical protein